jgi:hypothetical protein
LGGFACPGGSTGGVPLPGSVGGGGGSGAVGTVTSGTVGVSIGGSGDVVVVG